MFHGTRSQISLINSWRRIYHFLLKSSFLLQKSSYRCNSYYTVIHLVYISKDVSKFLLLTSIRSDDKSHLSKILYLYNWIDDVIIWNDFRTFLYHWHHDQQQHHTPSHLFGMCAFVWVRINHEYVIHLYTYIGGKLFACGCL